MTDPVDKLAPLFEQMSAEQLATAWARAGRALRHRNAVRTSNIVGDLAELIGAGRLGLERKGFSEKSIDAVSADGTTYQIKGRWLTPENPSRQLSAIRGPFDLLLAVMFDVEMRLSELWTIPHTVVEQHSTHVEHTNSLRFSLTRNVQEHPEVKRLL